MFPSNSFKRSSTGPYVGQLRAAFSAKTKSVSSSERTVAPIGDADKPNRTPSFARYSYPYFDSQTWDSFLSPTGKNHRSILWVSLQKVNLSDAQP